MSDRPAPIQFRDTEIDSCLAARAHADESPGTVARRDLTRYYAILDDAIRRLELSEPEALLICDALNGIRLDETGWRFAWATISDACRDGLADKWEVDGDNLVERIRSLTRAETLALVDAVERFWREPHRYECVLLREVGLAS